MATEKGVQILVTGRVQGVGFSHFTEVKAELNQIRGFVRNLADARVEVVGVGKRPALEALIKELQLGAPGKQGTKVLCPMAGRA